MNACNSPAVLSRSEHMVISSLACDVMMTGSHVQIEMTTSKVIVVLPYKFLPLKPMHAILQVAIFSYWGLMDVKDQAIQQCSHGKRGGRLEAEHECQIAVLPDRP